MKKFVVVTLLFILLANGACAMFGQTGTWRYKLTLVVDDNGTQRTGSSVVQVHVDRSGVKLSPESTPSITVKGEATVVDLGAKGALFALLDKGGPDHAYRVIFDVFPFHSGGTTSAGIEYYSHLKAKRDLPLENFPTLVRFRNIDDPDSAEEVNPKDLAKSFGPGVNLIKATIEMTDEPINFEIEKRLRWLSKTKESLSGNKVIFTNRLIDNIGTGAFRRN